MNVIMIANLYCETVIKLCAVHTKWIRAGQSVTLPVIIWLFALLNGLDNLVCQIEISPISRVEQHCQVSHLP